MQLWPGTWGTGMTQSGLILHDFHWRRISPSVEPLVMTRDTGIFPGGKKKNSDNKFFLAKRR